MFKVFKGFKVEEFLQMFRQIPLIPDVEKVFEELKIGCNLLYTASKVVMMDGRYIPTISSITRHAATHIELYEFATAPIFFAFGILFTLLLFPTPASSTAIIIFALGDSTAAIFGKILEKTTLSFNKGKTRGLNCQST